MVGNAKANSVSALLVTLGKNGLEPPTVLEDDLGPLQFPKDTGVKEAALLLIREKNNRYTMVRVSGVDSIWGGVTQCTAWMFIDI